MNISNLLVLTNQIWMNETNSVEEEIGMTAFRHVNQLAEIHKYHLTSGLCNKLILIVMAVTYARKQ